jgi:signal transduction histidine kinase
MLTMRNKELKQMFWAMCSITAGATTAALFISKAAAALVAITCVVLTTVFLVFTRSRYRHIAMLNDYLRRINSGEYFLDLPSYDEGELSILRSELYKITVSLREQNRLLRQDRLRLAEALSDISHQFKTPLTSMSVMADLLSDDRLDSNARREFSTGLRAQISRLTWLTDTLLKLSRLDAGAVKFNLRQVPLRELLDKACSPLAVPMELKNQALTVQAAGTAFCDLNWTAEALTNIVKNCVEHTPPGGQIQVTASQNPLFAEIQVSDSGPGIPKEDLPFIFQRFYKGRHASKDSVGIGLAMAKGVIEAQGGTLKAVSRGYGILSQGGTNGTSGTPGASGSVEDFRENSRKGPRENLTVNPGEEPAESTKQNGIGDAQGKPKQVPPLGGALFIIHLPVSPAQSGVRDTVPKSRQHNRFEVASTGSDTGPDFHDIVTG